jgi:hypothetical protein
MPASSGLEGLVSKRRDRPFEALDQGEEPRPSGLSAGAGPVLRAGGDQATACKARLCVINNSLAGTGRCTGSPAHYEVYRERLREILKRHEAVMSPPGLRSENGYPIHLICESASVKDKGFRLLLVAFDPFYEGISEVVREISYKLRKYSRLMRHTVGVIPVFRPLKHFIVQVISPR